MPRASEYAFPRQRAGLKPLKRSGGAAMMVMNLALPSERCEGFRPAHCKGKAYTVVLQVVLLIGTLDIGTFQITGPGFGRTLVLAGTLIT